MLNSMFKRAVSLVTLAGLGLAVISGMAATSAFAAEPGESAGQCLGVHLRQVRQHFIWKQPDTINIEIMKPNLFKVTLTKDGKKGVYAYDGCTWQSRKIR